MGNSIQDNLKKINTSLSFSDAVSAAVTAAFLVFSFAYFSSIFKENRKPVSYIQGGATETGLGSDSRPYGSRNGATYTYSWCQGGDRIKPENKVYYASAEEAESSNKRLSKLCQD